MKIVYYILFGGFGLLGAYFVLSSLFGRFHLWNLPPLQARAVLILAGCSAAWLMLKAYRLGELQGRWSSGIGMILLAVLLFQLVMLAGAFCLSGKGSAFFRNLF